MHMLLGSYFSSLCTVACTNAKLKAHRQAWLYVLKYKGAHSAGINTIRRSIGNHSYCSTVQSECLWGSCEQQSEEPGRSSSIQAAHVQVPGLLTVWVSKPLTALKWEEVYPFFDLVFLSARRFSLSSRAIVTTEWLGMCKAGHMVLGTSYYNYILDGT